MGAMILLGWANKIVAMPKKGWEVFWPLPRVVVWSVLQHCNAMLSYILKGSTLPFFPYWVDSVYILFLAMLGFLKQLRTWLTVPQEIDLRFWEKTQHILKLNLMLPLKKSHFRRASTQQERRSQTGGVVLVAYSQSVLLVAWYWWGSGIGGLFNSVSPSPPGVPPPTPLRAFLLLAQLRSGLFMPIYKQPNQTSRRSR